MESKIKDISLADWGRKELNLAEVEMPGLMSCRKEYGPNKVLKGARIMGSLHVTIQTAVLVETLKELGADLRWCSCNIFSTQDQAAAALVKNESAVVFAWKGESLEDYWELTMNALTWPDGKGPNVIVDDGGDATILLIEGLKWEKAYEKDNTQLPQPEKATSDDEKYLLELIRKTLLNHPGKFAKLTSELYGISEETTTGVHRLHQLEKQQLLQCPCINVNDSTTKSKFDNVYGCRHSLPDGLNRAADVMLAGKKVVVCGYGDVGKGSASSMKGCNARVYVTEIDPICALQACMEGYEVVRLEDVISDVDVVITTTGCKNVVMASHMSKMKNNAIVGNIGHFDNEIDTHGLKTWPGIKHVQIKEMLDRYEFPETGNGILLLAEGRLLNLGCATGHPSFVMSASFTNQTLAQIELWTNRDTNKYEKKVYKLPKKLDEKVARLHLDSLGAKLTELSQDQSEYMNIPMEGPYKNDEYRY